MPTSDAALPNVVSRENLAEANVLFFSSWGIMAGIGAGIGGYLTTVFSRETLFTIDIFTFIFSALLVFLIKKDLSEKVESTEKEKTIKFIDGINFVKSKKEIFALVLTKSTFSISASGMLALFTILSYDIYKTGDYGTGLMFGARGIGALIGPILIRFFFGKTDGKLLLTIGPSIMCWGFFYFLIPWSVTLYFTVILLVIAHSGGGAQWAFSTYGLQILTPDKLRGRIAGIDYSLVFLMNTISTLLIGYLASVYGPIAMFKVFPIFGFVFGLSWYLLTKNIWKNLDSK